MAELQHVVAPAGVAAGRSHGQVLTGRGRLVMVSGQIAQDERAELAGPGDPAAQARQMSENLRRCLASAGAGLGAAGKLTSFVLDVADLPAVRAARSAVDTAQPPASTAVRRPPCSRPVTCWKGRPGRWLATDHPAGASTRHDASAAPRKVDTRTQEPPIWTAEGQPASPLEPRRRGVLCWAAGAETVSCMGHPGENLHRAGCTGRS